MSDLGGPILRSQIRPFENSNSVSVSNSVINWIIFFPCIFVKLRQGSGKYRQGMVIKRSLKASERP